MSIYKIIGFYPDNIRLYQRAFLHKSSSIIEANDGRRINNERLEFLGDAILNFIIADILYKHFPNKREGFLTNTRSKIVQRDTLNRVAIELGIDKLLRFSSRLTGHNNHMNGNALEALIAAIYMDRGYNYCFRFIKDVLIRQHIDLDKISQKEVNFKSSLIEWSQKNKIDITFNLIESFLDRDGNQVFQTAAYLGEKQIGIGTGYSKKESQQNAAKMAVKQLRTNREVQQYVSKLKILKTGKKTEDNAFDELPDEESSND